jgi:tRNA A37 threonylcarbamoyladenosine biosynthesis protein TsaE
MVVPTKDTVSFSQLMEWNVKCMHGVFFTGVTGAGKTIACQKLMEKLGGSGDKFQAVSLY